MIFNSVTYLLMLGLTVGLYWLLSHRWRLVLLFCMSLLFYGFWRFDFIFVMLLSVVTDYVLARAITHQPPKIKKRLLLCSLAVNLGLLFYFKYLIFFSEAVGGVAALLGFELDPLALKIILPLGISFYTFQTISYTVDVYRGHVPAERNFILFGCYVMFFPQLIAGPILRAGEVIPQLAGQVPFQFGHLSQGLRLILYGLFLKVVLADNLAPMVDAGFQISGAALSAIDVWTIAFLFGFQIYFDFGAYSLIAIGSARLLGIQFPQNFDFPYIASSPREFWRRWHISLSSWIRDYLYLPLAGIAVRNRSTGGLAAEVAGKKKLGPLVLTWGLMGLWHGANWTFLIWGLYHALIIVAYRGFAGYVRLGNTRLIRVAGIMCTLPLMMLSWIPFRAQSVETVLAMWGKLLQFDAYFWLGMRENNYLVAALMLLGFFSTYLFQMLVYPRLKGLSILRYVMDTAMIAVMVAAVFIFLRPSSQFIYFQF